VITAGAGGFGDPKERSKLQLKEDLESGKFSKDFLAKEYKQFNS
jgi:N-methylhydantoinase B